MINPIGLLTIFATASLMTAVAFAQSTAPAPNVGYALYFNDKLVVLPDQTSESLYTREQADQNCHWNIKNKPYVHVRCVYNGEVLMDRPAATTGKFRMELDTDRPDANYRVFTMLKPDPEVCFNTCSQEPRCQAWTYYKINSASRYNAICALKDSVPHPMASDCCISGVK
ncbi:PAN domain-containing protein [Thiospirillum jenense]|uniref:PAN domain-containing protein n=1 Tax=Thiospirillum jenense TaxID=1653858 RepID=A0A839HC60_9GAMM|nr:PAN domain-containing protein [Thiospirillum jenense]